jgi:hypothetical protein
MVILAVAYILLFAILYFRIAGMASMEANAMKAEGKILQARLRIAFVVALLGGGAIVLLGDFVGSRPLRIVGLVCVFATVPIFFLRLFIGLRQSDRPSKK